MIRHNGPRISVYLSKSKHQQIIEEIERFADKRTGNALLMKDAELLIGLGMDNKYYDVSYCIADLSDSDKYRLQMSLHPEKYESIIAAWNDTPGTIKSNFIANLLAEVIRVRQEEPELLQILIKERLASKTRPAESSSVELDEIIKEGESVVDDLLPSCDVEEMEASEENMQSFEQLRKSQTHENEFGSLMDDALSNLGIDI